MMLALREALVPEWTGVAFFKEEETERRVGSRRSGGFSSGRAGF